MAQTMAEKLPYPAKVDGQPVKLFRNHADRVEYYHENPDEIFSELGLLAVAYFHDPAYREYEYIAAGLINQEGEEVWTKDFGLRELMVWLAGFARDTSESRTLRLIERSSGKFRDSYGWQPDMVIEDQPTDLEQESYIEHETHDLYTTKGMPIEFFEGDA